MEQSSFVKSVTKTFCAVLTTAALLVASTGVAEAGVDKQGTKLCSANQHGSVRSLSTGETGLRAPGDQGAKWYYNGNLWKVRTRSAAVAKGGFWAVTTNQSLNDSGTFASCAAGVPFA